MLGGSSSVQTENYITGWSLRSGSSNSSHFKSFPQLPLTIKSQIVLILFFQVWDFCFQPNTLKVNGMKFLLLTALKDYLKKKKINIYFQKVSLLSLNYIFACDVCSHKGVCIKNFIICHRPSAHNTQLKVYDWLHILTCPLVKTPNVGWTEWLHSYLIFTEHTVNYFHRYYRIGWNIKAFLSGNYIWKSVSLVIFLRIRHLRILNMTYSFWMQRAPE